MNQASFRLLRSFWPAVFVAALMSENAAEAISKVLLVSADGSGDYPDLQAAIDAAKPGDVIQLGPGIFETSIVITKPLTLRGAGWDKTRIQGRYFHPFDLEAAPEDIREEIAEYHRRANAAEGEEYEAILREMVEKLGPKPTLTLKHTRSVVVRGLSISLPGPVKKGGLMSVPAVLLADAQAKFTNVAVVDSAGDGVRLTAGAEAEFEHCLFASIRGTGLEIREPRDERAAAYFGAMRDEVGPVKVRDCDFRTFGYCGIVVGKGAADVSIKRCRVSQACYHGIYHRDSSPTIEDCLIFNNRRSGIYLRDKTAATIRNNVFVDNGIAAHEEASDTIEQNTFYGGATEPFRSGVILAPDTKVRLRRNIFQETDNGLTSYQKPEQSQSVEDIGSSLALTENLFWDNRQNFTIAPHEKKSGSEKKVVQLALPPSNEELDPGLVDPAAGNFSPKEGSSAERMRAGARPVIELKSPWAEQPAEKKLLETLGESFD